jgi:hypothetical protein
VNRRELFFRIIEEAEQSSDSMQSKFHSELLEIVEKPDRFSVCQSSTKIGKRKTIL